MHAYRTLLEQKIRERRHTFEEFVEYAETFARNRGEPGTLSVRHLQRLAAGRRPDGRPLGRPLPATMRLLEQIFGIGIDELLGQPTHGEAIDDPNVEIRNKINISSRVGIETVELLRDQLTAIRRLDRQLGAVVAHDEVLVKVNQVRGLFAHSLTGNVRDQLAALLSETLCLAGWQALDRGKTTEAWRHYGDARAAALETSVNGYLALAEAGRAFVLSDIGESASAASLLVAVHENLVHKCSPLLQSWLAAAYGETLAATDDRTGSLCAFDRAIDLLPADPMDPGGPYVALDPIHLARWRGSALARFVPPDAFDVLTGALERLDPTFKRAETALRVDLAAALMALDEPNEAHRQARTAGQLAMRIGSVRQQRRVGSLISSVR